MRYIWITLAYFILVLVEVVQLLSEDNCVCAQFSKCGDQTNHPLIDLRRARFECDDYFEVCCDPKDIHQGVLKPSPPRQGCGYANHDGVTFQIVGNTDNESQFGEFPWMIAVLGRDPSTPTEFVYQNGGSLIHPEVVVTTASRVAGKSSNDLKIRAGEYDRQTVQEPLAHEDRNVDEIIIHPDYTTSLAGNNIALLILERPLGFARHIDTICLPPQNYQFDFNDCFVSGWGEVKLLNGNVYANILKKRKLSGVSNQICLQKYKAATKKQNFYIHPSYMCAGDESNKVVCEGDGGSPLVCPIPYTINKYIQVGIVAMGIDCKKGNVPALYTKLSLYRDWINEKMNERHLQLYT